MRISPINTISFRTQHIQKPEANYGAKDAPVLNHSTAFFRYNDIDEFIFKILKNKNKNIPLNILSAGCSYGEEVYSYAMGLSDLKNKPNIVGIDISEKTIKEAKQGIYMLDNSEIKLFEEDGPLGFSAERTEFDHEKKRLFNAHFELIDPIFHTYRKRENLFENCSFEQLNISHLSEKFKNNSQDAILCRYVLYHLKNSDIKAFFKEAYDTLKPEGILCIEPFGYYKYQSALTDLGFEQPYKEAPCIFRKPKKLKAIGDFLKQRLIQPTFEKKLNNEANFNNIQQSFEENLFVHF